MEMKLAQLPEAERKRLPAYPVPVIRLSRLAVALDAQGRGEGSALLRHVNLLALELSAEKIGCAGVLVDAKPDAREFYARYGFFALEPEAGALPAHLQSTPMFLGVHKIRAALTSH